MFGGSRRADLRAAETRAFFEQQNAGLLRQASLAAIPPRLAPVPIGRVAETLSYHFKDPATAEARSAALAGLSSHEDHPLLGPLLGESLAACRETRGRRGSKCWCCPDRACRDGHHDDDQHPMPFHRTDVYFDPESFITTARTKIVIQPASAVSWDELVRRFDPTNWKQFGKEYFANSDPIDPVPRRGDRRGWRGRLHERFDWHWNPQAKAMFENHLGVDFAYDATTIRCTYWLHRSISSNLWIAREPGGLDVDNGVTKAELNRRENKVVVQALKRIRFTEPELGPDGSATLLNYMAPTTIGLWMHQGVFRMLADAIVAAGSPGKAPGDSRPRMD